MRDGGQDGGAVPGKAGSRLPGEGDTTDCSVEKASIGPTQPNTKDKAPPQ